MILRRQVPYDFDLLEFRPKREHEHDLWDGASPLRECRNLVEFVSRLVDMTIPWTRSWQIRVDLVESARGKNSKTHRTKEANSAENGESHSVDQHIPFSDVRAKDVGEVALKPHIDVESSKENECSRHVCPNDSGFLNVGNHEQCNCWPVSKELREVVENVSTTHVLQTKQSTKLTVSDKY